MYQVMADGAGGATEQQECEGAAARGARHTRVRARPGRGDQGAHPLSHVRHLYSTLRHGHGAPHRRVSTYVVGCTPLYVMVMARHIAE